MGEFEQSRSEEILTQTLRKLNGEAVSELAPPQSRMETLLQQLLDKIGSGSGGGGSGGVLAVTETIQGNTHTLTKTFREIYSAISSGILVFIYMVNGDETEGETVIAIVGNAGFDSSGCGVVAFNPDYFSEPLEYLANSADDYPAREFFIDE